MAGDNGTFATLGYMPSRQDCKQIAARVPLPLVARLDQIAARDDRTTSAVMREALRQYVAVHGGDDDDREPARDEYRRRRMAA